MYCVSLYTVTNLGILRSVEVFCYRSLAVIVGYTSLRKSLFALEPNCNDT